MLDICFAGIQHAEANRPQSLCSRSRSPKGVPQALHHRTTAAWLARYSGSAREAKTSAEKGEFIQSSAANSSRLAISIIGSPASASRARPANFPDRPTDSAQGVFVSEPIMIAPACAT
jgi:hypothetical protein